MFVGDHRQTPGGLSRGRAAASNRRKLLHRLLGSVLLTVRVITTGQTSISHCQPLAGRMQGSDLSTLPSRGMDMHSGPWITVARDDKVPPSLVRLLGASTMSRIDLRSGLNAAALALILIATLPEEFWVPECTDTLEAADLSGPHRWGLILPNSSSVSLLTYKAIVAVRYPELVLHDQSPIHFVSHEHTADHGGFRAIFWEHPKDLRAAVDDVVVMLEHLRQKHKEFRQGATSQLMVLCNRTAVHDQLRQHGFHTAWHGGIRVSTVSSAGARIAVVQTGCGQRVKLSVRGGHPFLWSWHVELRSVWTQRTKSMLGLMAHTPGKRNWWLADPVTCDQSFMAKGLACCILHWRPLGTQVWLLKLAVVSPWWDG